MVNLPSTQIQDGKITAQPAYVGGRNILKINKNGTYENIILNRNQLSDIGVKARDLRLLDLYSGQQLTSSILVREQAMVINLLYVQCVISRESVYIPTADQEVAFRFVQGILQMLRQSSKQQKQQSRAQNQQNPVNASYPHSKQKNYLDLPFQLKAIDVCIEQVMQELETQVQQIEFFTAENVNKIRKGVSTYNLELLRRYKMKLVLLNTRVQGVKEAFKELIEDEKDNQLFNIFASDTYSDFFKPSQSFRQLVSQESLSRFDKSTFNQARAQIQLESYYQQVNVLFRRLEDLEEYIDNEEDLAKLELDNHRNNIIQTDMVLTTINACFAALVLIAAIFGQNLPIPISDDPNGNIKVAIISCSLAVFIFIFIIAWLRYQGFLAFTIKKVSKKDVNINLEEETKPQNKRKNKK